MTRTDDTKRSASRCDRALTGQISAAGLARAIRGHWSIRTACWVRRLPLDRKRVQVHRHRITPRVIMHHLGRGQPRGSAKSACRPLTCSFVCDWCGACRCGLGVGPVVKMEVLTHNAHTRVPRRDAIMSYRPPVSPAADRGVRSSSRSQGPSRSSAPVGDRVDRRTGRGSRRCQNAAEYRRVESRCGPGFAGTTGNRS